MKKDGLEGPQNPPAIWCNLAGNDEEIVEDVFDEGVEGESHPILKGV